MEYNFLQNKKCLFIGILDCNDSKDCVDFLKNYCSKVTPIFCKGRNEKIPKEMAEWQGDFIFSFRNYFKIPKSILDSARLMALNFHGASPAYPGSGSYNWAIYENAKYFGTTVHLMNEKIDNGKIIKFFKYSISRNETVFSLIKKSKINNKNYFKEFIVFLNKQNREKIIDLKEKKSRFNWSGEAKKISDLDKMRHITKDLTNNEILKRIRAFHMKEFPVYTIINGVKFFYIE